MSHDPKRYAATRRPHHSFTIDFLFDGMPSSPYILDIGCGTGISSRQLRERGAMVIGIDSDPRMLAEAQAACGDITYWLMNAESLTTQEGIFDAVTAFSAFHNFDQLRALVEAMRVLKQGGIFFVTNHYDWEFSKGYRDVLAGFTPEGLPPEPLRGEDWDPSAVIAEAGFANVERRIVHSLCEHILVQDAVGFVESTKCWSLIPAEKHGEAKRALEEHFLGRTVGYKHMYIEKHIRVVSVKARKP